jgi:hypothetical protein
MISSWIDHIRFLYIHELVLLEFNYLKNHQTSLSPEN